MANERRTIIDAWGWMKTAAEYIENGCEGRDPDESPRQFATRLRAAAEELHAIAPAREEQ